MQPRFFDKYLYANIYCCLILFSEHYLLTFQSTILLIYYNNKTTISMEVFSYISIITKTILYTSTELKLVHFDYKILNILYFFVSFITILLQIIKS